MSPVKKNGRDDFRKDVEFVEKDEDEQIGVGIVMVPDKADLQRDFVREDTIREFANQFETFAEAGEADGGIMHAVWPSEWMELEANRVLDEAEEIGGTEAPAGAWVQEWRFNNEDLWALVDDEILGGYSIGAINVRWEGGYEQSELDDVAVPDQLEDDVQLYEIVSGIIREVSAVDIPAVPDAQILQTKADTEKRLGDYLGDPNGFVEEAMERGHSEEEAERLWEVLNDAVEIEGATEPGDKSVVGRLLSALSVGGSKSGGDGSRPDREDRRQAKEGRTLSQQNRHSLYATIDSSLDILQDAGVDHGMTRFTDREDTNFDLSDHTARDWPDPDDEEEDQTDVSIPGMENDAPEGDTSDDTTTMGDDTPDDGEEKSLAEQNAEQINELTAAVDSLTDAVQESEEKADEAGDGDEDPWDDAPEWAHDLKEQQEKNADRIDEISKQTATGSQQLGKAAEEEEKDSGFTLDPRKAQGGN